LTARALVCAFAVVAAAGVARADDPYALPAVGAQLTYRLVSTTKIADKSIIITSGQVYTYIVATADGPTVTGTIKPVALIYGCPPNAADKDCAFANKAAGAKRDGDRVTVPVPDAIADGLVKESGFKLRYFVNEERKFPLPGAKNPDDPGDAEFGATPVFVLNNSLICDFEQLRSFLPFGKTPHLALPCHNVFSRTHSRIGTDQTTQETISMDLTYDGSGHLSLPSGDWEVEKIAIKFMPGDASHPTVRSEFQVAPKLGIPVKTHTVADNSTTHVTTESDSELIAVKP
jgi:hypothetical protein